MWIDEKLGICLSLVPGITLWIFTIVCLRKKVNKEEFLCIIKGGFILIFWSAFISSLISGILILLSYIVVDYSDNIMIIISILVNIIVNIFLFGEAFLDGNIYKLEDNGLTYYENNKLKKLLKKELKTRGIKPKTECDLKHKIESERKETGIYIYPNGDEAVKIGYFYERMKKSYEYIIFGKKY